MKPTKYFLPAGKIIREDETFGQRLQRLARAALPVLVVADDGARKQKRRYCACGAALHKNPKVRQKQMVCDDCAIIIPRWAGGKQAAYPYSCAACHTGFPRAKMRMKDKNWYCKKCLKIKFQIDIL